MRQFKAGPDWTLNDRVTITPESLAGTASYIKKLFHHMIVRINEEQTEGPGQRPGATLAPNAQHANQTEHGSPQRKQSSTAPAARGSSPQTNEKSRLTTNFWEDEGTLCYLVHTKGYVVSRREGNVEHLKHIHASEIRA